YASSTLFNAGGVFASDPSSAQNPSGNTFVVARDNSNTVWSNIFNVGSQTWAGWQSAGGSIQGVPTMAVDVSGTGWIAARDNFTSSWIARVSGNSWTGWFNGGAAASIDPRIAALGGSLGIVILDAGGAVWRASFTEGAGNGWQSWTGIGGSLADIAPAANGG